MFIRKILVSLIPVKKWRRYVRARVLWNNQIIVVENGISKKLSFWQNPKGLKINIMGRNNLVTIKFPIKLCNSEIFIRSDNTITEIEAKELRKVNIFYNNGDCQTCEIKEGTTIYGADIFIEDSNTGVIIGEDCMFSYGIVIRTSDAHSILDKDTKKILNFPKGILQIGNHCWVGQNVVIGKNAKLPDNTIVGLAAVVTKPFIEEYTALGGNPARVIKRNITWDRKFIFEHQAEN